METETMDIWLAISGLCLSNWFILTAQSELDTTSAALTMMLGVLVTMIRCLMISLTKDLRPMSVNVMDLMKAQQKLLDIGLTIWILIWTLRWKSNLEMMRESN